MTSFDNVLPQRPIRIKRTGVWPGIFRYLGALLLLGLALFFAIWQVPGVADDWMISQDPVLVEDALISDGECSTSRGFFVDCSAHVSYAVKGKQIERDIELMFLDFGSGDYAVDVVRSDREPAKATLSLGLDMLWNRTITVGVMVVLLAIFGLALFRSGLQQDRNRRLAMQGSRLSLVAVPVLQLNKVIGGTVVQYQYGVGKKQQALLTTSRFKKNEAPLWLEEDGTTALAVMPERGAVPVLLDDRLERLDLTAAERAEIKAKLAGA
ncbi:hypothetical protein [Devosia rhizoryzae]|uniref:DUF3592 domain-containing protein n=1 Tax=Devosia rhizoryzae TaxID=2774137 RepID=A0ABX7C850_9HYPH|nr:hypothetical protein [Devosia rhizoryzae]QQR39917.1 hypothetical protein JI748_02565 [Devosia rhizoryzae]